MKQYRVIGPKAYRGNEFVAKASSGEESDDVEIEALEKLVTQANMALALLNAAKVAMSRIQNLRPNEAHEALSEVVALAEKNCP